MRKTIDTSNGDDPHIAARSWWDDRVERAFSSARAWRIIGMAGMMGMVGSLGWALHLASEPRFVPFVVALDAEGRATPLRSIARDADAGALRQRAVRAYLADWIENARLVTPHIALQREAIDRVYAMLHMKDPAKGKVDRWWNPADPARNPYSRAKTCAVIAHVTAVQSVVPGVWEASWAETVQDLDGNAKETFRMRAKLTVYETPPTEPATEQTLSANPLGLYVQDLDWGRALD
jgi:type IV secretory pathway TrbF-like protein